MNAHTLHAALAQMCAEGAYAERKFLASAAEMAPYLREWRDVWRGEAAAVALPSCTADVAGLVRLARRHGAHLVPQGGNTGLVGGQIAFDRQRAIVVSLKRMNRILRVDAAENALTCEAGCLLADVQAAAETAGRLFPLSLASQGSCSIGGVLSTNAGGCGVLRYGSAGDLALGLEAVLADGSVWDGRRALRKDNTGYDLKRLFIGAEGSLGIVTGAVLRLFARPRSSVCAFAATPTPEAGLSLLRAAEEASGGEVSAFELLPRIALELVARHIPAARLPLPPKAPWHVLVEISSARRQAEAAGVMERILQAGFDNGWVTDAVMAQNTAQEAEFWLVRESVSEAQKREGGSIKHDVAVPVSQVPAFLRRAAEAVQAALPGARVVAFGHVGDGNIHFNLSQPEGMGRQAFAREAGRLQRIVYDLVGEMGGSISAEHGIGVAKREENARWKPPEELELMRKLKRALDPDGIFNPGKLTG